MLLADRNSKAWDFAEKIKSYFHSVHSISVPLEEVSVSHFRNGEIDMHVPSNMRERDIYFIHDSSKNPQEWWIELLLLKDLILSSSANSVSFVLPNMFYSRKDRKDKPHVPISARALANSISSGTKRIITMDLHAAQIQGIYPPEVPVDNLYSFPEAVKHLRKNHPGSLENLAVVSPDAGGAERAKAFLKKLEKAQEHDVERHDYSFALISKTRPRAGEVDSMELVGDVEGKNILIVDDIIDSGGTLCKAGELLRRKGAKKLFCYGTHGFFTKGTEELKKSFYAIMTSNTIYREKNDVEVVDVSGIFAEAIYRSEKGISVSKLFE